MAQRMTPRPFICANWKMNLTPSESEAFTPAFLAALSNETAQLGDAVEVGIAPAHPGLERLGRALADTPIQLAAQNVHAEVSGAFTGEVSLDMLEDLGCRYALIGHSERRQLFGEDDEIVAGKVARLVGSSVTPILCVGETLEEREREATLEIVSRQLISALAGADGLGADLVVAYEPVWAIGTGRTATPEMAEEVHAAIRGLLVEHLGDEGASIRILYGGSVKPSNAKELLSQPNVHGALVGGASLDPEAFASIVLASLETP